MQAPKSPHQWRQGRKRYLKILVETLKGKYYSINFTNFKGKRLDRDALLSLQKQVEDGEISSVRDKGGT